MQAEESAAEESAAEESAADDAWGFRGVDLEARFSGPWRVLLCCYDPT